MVERFSANSNDGRIKPVVELKDEILENLIKMLEGRNIPADDLTNALVNVLAGLVLVAADGNKEKLVEIANNIRYGIISLYDSEEKQ